MNIETINNEIKKFFENNKTEEVFTLVNQLEVKYDLTTREAYGYVSKYLSKCWGV